VDVPSFPLGKIPYYNGKHRTYGYYPNANNIAETRGVTSMKRMLYITVIIVTVATGI